MMIIAIYQEYTLASKIIILYLRIKKQVFKE